MAAIRLTFWDYVIAAITMTPAAAAYFYQNELATWLGVTPKIVMGLSVVLATLISVALSWIKNPRYRRPVKLWHRLAGLGILAGGVTYFFYREEIADAVHWPVRSVDSIAIFVCVVMALCFVSVLPPRSDQSE